jgi:hypothetical protein
MKNNKRKIKTSLKIKIIEKNNKIQIKMRNKFNSKKPIKMISRSKMIISYKIKIIRKKINRIIKKAQKKAKKKNLINHKKAKKMNKLLIRKWKRITKKIIYLVK